MASRTLPLMFGAGERIAALRTLLSPLAGDAHVVEDLAALLEAPEAPATLVVDADRLSADDVVFVRRFARRASESRIVLIGDDASRRAARELLRLESARWIAWPPDVLHLIALVEPAPTFAPRAASTPLAPAPERTLEAIDEIAEIEAILGAPRGTTPPATSRPERTTGRPAPYFRDQVADLADIAQRIELTLNVARESAESGSNADGAVLASVSSEVERLMQFTRTLGYLVAPPASGEQVFDVGELLDVLIAGGVESPRYVFRRDRALFVRSDRQLLGQAFDAFLCLARGAGRGEVVRIDVKGVAADDPQFGEVTIEFPAAALHGFDLARAIEPYALRSALPELGPNALAAAIGIVSGQGGRAELLSSAEGRLSWRIRLKLALADAPAAGRPRKHATP